MHGSFFKIKKQAQRGFTLVEIAIVLVIVGLLIGGILRGQELINSARVTALVNQQRGIQTGYLGFINRFNAIPGDLTAAQAAQVGVGANAAQGTQGDSVVLLGDSQQFFNNLTVAGFISCAPCTSAVAALSTPTAVNSPSNAYSQPLGFIQDPTVVGGITAGSFFATSTAGELARPLLLTGSGYTSAMLAEADRKLDDGTPGSGSFRYSDASYTGLLAAVLSTAGTSKTTNGSGAIASCVALTATTGVWIAAPPAPNCQGASLF